jgi:hypothetical protein
MLKRAAIARCYNGCHCEMLTHFVIARRYDEAIPAEGQQGVLAARRLLRPRRAGLAMTSRAHSLIKRILIACAPYCDMLKRAAIARCYNGCHREMLTHFVIATKPSLRAQRSRPCEHSEAVLASTAKQSNILIKIPPLGVNAIY